MGDERRRWPRYAYAGGRLPPAARIRPGDVVIVVNLSRCGALVESGLRLRWGTRCDFEWTAGETVVSVAARVARCFVARVDASAVRYRTALRFDLPIAPPAEQDLLAEYHVPARVAAGRLEGVVGSRQASVTGPVPPEIRGTRPERRM